MAKTSISVTIDGKLRDELSSYAKSENRTFSNFLEVILTEYLRKRAEETELKKSFSRAKLFASKLEITDYNSTEKEIEKHIHLTEEELRFLNNK